MDRKAVTIQVPVPSQTNDHIGAKCPTGFIAETFEKCLNHGGIPVMVKQDTPDSVIVPMCTKCVEEWRLSTAARYVPQTAEEAEMLQSYLPYGMSLAVAEKVLAEHRKESGFRYGNPYDNVFAMPRK